MCGCFLLKIFYVTIFIFCAIFLTSCGVNDSPKTALEEIQTALNQKNFKNFSERVDIQKLFAQIYDESTIQLAKNCEVYGKKYPRDPYFQHGGDFIKNYNAEHRDLHLNFAEKSLKAYFENIPAPENPQDNPHAYVANEFEKLHLVSTAEIEDVQIEDNHATLTVNVQGDTSLRGVFVGLLTFKLNFQNVNDKWKLTAIENVEELTPTFVDKAELIWINF